VRPKRSFEGPTFLLALAVHAAWMLSTLMAVRHPWVGVICGGFVVAWHGSLQHETIHGHPTRSRAVNALLGSLPMGLWLPYGIYREQHLDHHRTSALTDPLEDPESQFVTGDAWRAASPVRRAILLANATLLGRLVLGPAIVLVRFFLAEARRIVRGDLVHARAWLGHAAGVVVVLAWLELVCAMPLWQYVLTFVYPGLALTLLRSFAEHRPATEQAHRIAVVEAGPIASLLYLNNNLHVVHHDEPAVPWYELPERYRATREDVLAKNGGLAYAGYGALLWHFGVRARYAPVHPAHAASALSASPVGLQPES